MVGAESDGLTHNQLVHIYKIAKKCSKQEPEFARMLWSHYILLVAIREATTGPLTVTALAKYVDEPLSTVSRRIENLANFTGIRQSPF